MEVTRITSAQDLTAESIPLERRLHEVPGADEICLEPTRPHFARRRRHSDRQSFWTASDGATVVCHTLTGLGRDE
jgi:hypothetical protein